MRKRRGFFIFFFVSTMLVENYKGNWLICFDTKLFAKLLHIQLWFLNTIRYVLFCFCFPFMVFCRMQNQEVHFGIECCVKLLNFPFLIHLFHSGLMSFIHWNLGLYLGAFSLWLGKCITQILCSWSSYYYKHALLLYTIK